jgi:hypothetical protein
MPCKQENTQSGGDIGIIEGTEEEQRRKEADVESRVDLLRTQIGQRKKKSRLLAWQLLCRTRWHRRSSVKKKEKDGEKGKSVDSPQSIQVTAASDFIEEDGDNIKTRWSCYFWIPVPVVTTTVFLDLTDVENLILK